jgi:galactose mutarotase-like enzyme
VVIWSRSTSDPFYCIEPWTALPNAFSRRDTGELTLVPPGGEFRAAMHMDIRLMA